MTHCLKVYQVMGQGRDVVTFGFRVLGQQLDSTLRLVRRSSND